MKPHVSEIGFGLYSGVCFFALSRPVIVRSEWQTEGVCADRIRPGKIWIFIVCDFIDGVCWKSVRYMYINLYNASSNTKLKISFSRWKGKNYSCDWTLVFCSCPISDFDICHVQSVKVLNFTPSVTRRRWNPAKRDPWILSRAACTCRPKYLLNNASEKWSLGNKVWLKI